MGPAYCQPHGSTPHGSTVDAVDGRPNTVNKARAGRRNTVGRSHNGQTVDRIQQTRVQQIARRAVPHLRRVPRRGTHKGVPLRPGLQLFKIDAASPAIVYHIWSTLEGADSQPPDLGLDQGMGKGLDQNLGYMKADAGKGRQPWASN